MRFLQPIPARLPIQIYCAGCAISFCGASCCSWCQLKTTARSSLCLPNHFVALARQDIAHPSTAEHGERLTLRHGRLQHCLHH
ncbi:hypothetical protein N431DRAFT_5139 [Stipitochalara longipes BDJ]|nr:hypothetical protein N431DRAFT_5139 [Stipitochalara longipes BDJ]